MQLSPRAIARTIKHSLLGKPVPRLDSRLASLEKVFRSPSFTRDLVGAIRLISPHCDFAPNDKFKEVWEADQNGACWAEFEAVAPILRNIPKTAKILEIGPGMGRSLVFFSKKLDWSHADLHAYEGDGKSTKYTFNGPRFQDSFCGNLQQLRTVLQFNGVRNVTLHDAHTTPMSALPGPFDLVYAFYSVGFHWSLEHFLDDLVPLMHERTIAVFTVTEDFQPFPRLEQFHYRLVRKKKVWPANDWVNLLVMSKGPLPA